MFCSDAFTASYYTELAFGLLMDMKKTWCCTQGL